mgnify:FL=1
MTCSGCAAKVTYEMQQIDSVSSVTVDLFTEQVAIESERKIDIAEVTTALLPYPKYKASKLALDTEIGPALNRIHWRTYWPLILIGIFVSAVSAGITWRTDGTATTWMECFMSGFFLIFSFFKLLDIQGFAASYQSYDLMAKVLPAYGFVYPFLEFSLGMAWAIEGGTFSVALSTVILMGFSAIGVITAVTRKQNIQCACLGTAFNLPMSTVTIIEDLIMVGMAGALLIP